MKSFTLGTLFLTALFSLGAQEQGLDEILPAFKGKAMVLSISAGIMEQNREVSWDTEADKITISGRPVSFKLMGPNIVVAALFTPYRRHGKTMLVAQGQVWLDIPGEGMRYQTTMQTMPLEYGEKIYFFPLGEDEAADGENSGDGNARIVIQLELNPYHDDGENAQGRMRGHGRGRAEGGPMPPEGARMPAPEGE